MSGGNKAPYDIPHNPLLRGDEKMLPMSRVLGFKEIADHSLAQNPIGDKSSMFSNLRRVPSEILDQILQYFGESGLFKFMFLCTAYQPSEFDHIYKLIECELARRTTWSTTRPVKLACDNTLLPQSAKLARFNSNVVQPSLSRKLYNPGGRNGIIVYGLGGPRILVSHPFRGASKDLYDVYTNSADVVRGLVNRGFLGTFLFLDYLPGLNIARYDTSAWLLWFSIISAHSDMVAYVTDKDDLVGAQKLEAEFTPDRVAKKIIRFEIDEFGSARDYKKENSFERMYFIPGKGRPATLAEWNEMEAEFALPFVEAYYGGAWPADRLFQISESGKVSEYPSNAFRWH
jgi:hypothetical protein